MNCSMHMHSKLNNNKVSCSATCSTSFYNSDLRTQGLVNDCLYPVHEIFSKLMKPTGDHWYVDHDPTGEEIPTYGIVDKTWAYDNTVNPVYSITSTDFIDENSDYNVVYHFTLCIKNIKSLKWSDTWSLPETMQCTFDVIQTSPITEKDFWEQFADAYFKFIKSCYPDYSWSEVTPAPSGYHNVCEYFQVTCANCSIKATSESLPDDDILD